jgi:drug/metabolite transporter (DMT)-like permease
MSKNVKTHSHTTDGVGRAIAFMLAASFVFACQNMLVKWLAPDYPVVQIAFFRSAFSLLPSALLLALDGGFASLRTSRPLDHVLRAAFGLSSTLLIYLAFGLMPLAEAVALSFTSPLFITALSWPLLAERVGFHRWLAVLAGFGGVLLIIRPSGELLGLGTPLALASALLFALAMITIRRLGKAESPSAIAFHFALLSTLMTAPLVPFFWKTPDLEALAIFAVLGIAGGIGQYMMAEAYRRAAAAVVGPFSYSALIWACLFGMVLWGERPGLTLMAGALLLAASGIYMLISEARDRRPPAPRPAAPSRIVEAARGHAGRDSPRRPFLRPM